MNKTVTFDIDEKLDNILNEECRITGKNRSEIVQDILKRKLLLASFERARKVSVPLGEAAGYITDEDVFRDIS